MERKPMGTEEMIIRSMVARYLDYRAAILRNDGYMINMEYGSMNNMKHVLIQTYGWTTDRAQDLIALIEEVIKNGQSKD